MFFGYRLRFIPYEKKTTHIYTPTIFYSDFRLYCVLNIQYKQGSAYIVVGSDVVYFSVCLWV